MSKMIGFYVLSDGSFIKIHRSLKIEMIRPSGTQFIEAKSLPFQESINDGTHASYLYRYVLEAHLVELPHQQIALAYRFSFEESHLLIVDLEINTWIAYKKMPQITSMFFLSPHFLLINSKWIYTLNLKIAEDRRFKDFYLKQKQYGTYYPLPNGVGIIYSNTGEQSSLTLLTNQFEEKNKLNLFSKTYDPFYSNNCLYKGPSYESHITHRAFLSDNLFVCITREFDKYTWRYTYQEKNTHYLHIIHHDLTKTHKINLQHLKPQYLIILSNHYIAIIGSYKGSSKANAIKIYDTRGVKLHKLFLNDVTGCRFAATPQGQLVSCDPSGIIVIHHILPLIEKLRLKTHAILKKKMPKVLIPIITDYAGFFNPAARRIRGYQFDEKNYEKKDFFSTWRSKH
jgi:hypothetical protein